MKANTVQWEVEIQRFWKDEQVFQKIVNRNPRVCVIITSHHALRFLRMCKSANLSDDFYTCFSKLIGCSRMCNYPEGLILTLSCAFLVKVVFEGLSKDCSLHMYTSCDCNFFLESLHFVARVLTEICFVCHHQEGFRKVGCTKIVGLPQTNSHMKG